MNATALLRETRFDPVFTGQDLFRRILEATARPGSVIFLGDLPLSLAPAPLRPACALLMAVLDLEVTLHVLGPGAADVAAYLHSNTGVRAAALGDAEFILVTGDGSGGQIARARRGTLLAPHGGATVVYAPVALRQIRERPGVGLRVTGPGVPGERRLVVTGVPPREFDALRELMAFPLGVDVWLAAADGTLAALPRSAGWRRED